MHAPILISSLPSIVYESHSTSGVLTPLVEWLLGSKDRPCKISSTSHFIWMKNPPRLDYNELVWKKWISGHYLNIYFNRLTAIRRYVPDIFLYTVLDSTLHNFKKNADLAFDIQWHLPAHLPCLENIKLKIFNFIPVNLLALAVIEMTLH